MDHKKWQRILGKNNYFWLWCTLRIHPHILLLSFLPDIIFSSANGLIPVLSSSLSAPSPPGCTC